MFAMDFGLQFGIWDYEWILNEMPRSIFTHWHAKYILAPWDMSNRMAIAESGYKAPVFLKPKDQYMTGRDIRNAYKRANR